LLRLLIVLISIFFLPEKDTCKPSCFKVVNATKQMYVAGIKYGGKGTNYRITCIANKSSDILKIEKLWVGKDYFEVKAIKFAGITPQENFSAGDTIFIEASRFISGKEGESQESATPAPAAPIKYKGEGLIGFRCGTKMKYRSVAKFTELPRINTP
jgi:hypothetical protein